MEQSARASSRVRRPTARAASSDNGVIRIPVPNPVVRARAGLVTVPRPTVHFEVETYRSTSQRSMLPSPPPQNEQEQEEQEQEVEQEEEEEEDEDMVADSQVDADEERDDTLDENVGVEDDAGEYEGEEDNKDEKTAQDRRFIALRHIFEFRTKAREHKNHADVAGDIEKILVEKYKATEREMAMLFG